MKSMGFLFVALIIATALLGVCYISLYNTLNSTNQHAERAWGDVESTLQRRADLVPNLVNTVKGYAAHEKEVLEKVTEARAKVGSINVNAAGADPEQMKKLAAAQGELHGALSRLIAVAENYPQLKADGAFRDLQSQLEGTENRINIARQRYNEAVEVYNAHTNGFFGSIVASRSTFRERPYFKAEPEAQKAPTVKFN